MAKVKYKSVFREVKENVPTSHTQLPSCNKQVISYTAQMNRTTEVQVKDILYFIGRYTHDVLEKGIMETVMLPYFGKFKPKVHELRAKAMLKEKLTGKHLILRAIREMEALENKNDETAGG